MKATFFYSAKQERVRQSMGDTHSLFIDGKQYTEVMTNQQKRHVSNYPDAVVVAVYKNLPAKKYEITGSKPHADTKQLNITFK